MNVRKFLDGDVVADSALGTRGLADKRQVLVNCSAGGTDRQGDIVDQAGIDFKNFIKTGGTVLWQHDPSQPIARAASIGLDGGNLRSLVQFPDEGISPKADEIYGLVRAGVINSTSIGFAPIRWEPLNPKEPWGGRKYLEIELMEFSFVSVPAMVDATVIARSAGRKDGDAALVIARSAGADLTVADHAEEIVRHLQAATKCLARANSSHADAEGHLAQMAGWLGDGMKHAHALHAAGGLGGGSTDASEDDDNAELAIEAPRNSQTPAAAMTPAARKAALNRLDRADVGRIYRVGTVVNHIAPRPVPLPPAAKGGGAFTTASVLESELKRLRALW